MQKAKEGAEAKLEQQESGMMNEINSIPCFACDGRKVGPDGITVCRRCKGTGVVNTQHEKTLKSMINFFIKKHLQGGSVPQNVADIVNSNPEPVEQPQVDKKEK